MRTTIKSTSIMTNVLKNELIRKTCIVAEKFHCKIELFKSLCRVSTYVLRYRREAYRNTFNVKIIIDLNF